MILPDGQFRFVFSPRSYEASAAFYRDDLQLPIDHEWDFGGGDRGVVFIAGGGMIELLGAGPDTRFLDPGGFSLLIQVNDADAWYARAQERGLRILQEPVSYPWGHRIVRLADPEGIVISLFSLIKAG